MRWSDVYLSELDKDELAAVVARELGVGLTRRDSYYSGGYYLFEDDDLEIIVNANRYEDGELVFPDLPHSSFVCISGTSPHEIRQRVQALGVLSPHRPS